MAIHISQHSLLKRLLFPLLNGLGTLVKNHLAIFMRVYLWALCSVPLVYMSVFIPVAHCFDYCSFVISFKIRKCETFGFVLQDCLGYSESSRFHMNLRMDFSISRKKTCCLEFDRNCIKSVDSFG